VLAHILLGADETSIKENDCRAERMTVKRIRPASPRPRLCIGSTKGNSVASKARRIARTAEPRTRTQKAAPMFKHKKVRQATMILFATAVILILPNLTRLVS